PPAGGAIRDKGRAELSGPCRLADLPDDRLVPAAAEACVGRRPVAADRAFVRRHPAADPGADCPAAIGWASAGPDCTSTSRCLLVALETPDVNAWTRGKLRRKTADRAYETRTDIGTNFRQSSVAA